MSYMGRRAPGLWGYVALSMLIHVLVFSIFTQYRTSRQVMQLPPVFVRIIPPAPTPSPLKQEKQTEQAVVPKITPKAQDTVKIVPRTPAKPEADLVPDLVPDLGPEPGLEKVAPEQEKLPISSAPVFDKTEHETEHETEPEPVTDELKPEGMEGDLIRPQAPGRDAIFDSEIIARRALEPAEKGDSETGITFDPANIVLRGYMGLVKERVERAWEYPYAAKKERIFGDLLIRFVIRRDGTLGDVHIRRTSGHVVLDNAAMKALKDAEPFWPLPEGFQEEALTVNGRFIYTLSGRYIR